MHVFTGPKKITDFVQALLAHYLYTVVSKEECTTPAMKHQNNEIRYRPRKSQMVVYFTTRVVIVVQ
jgi:hypothetical protein